MPPLLEWPQQAALHHTRAPQLNPVSFRPRVLLSLQPSPTMPELLPLPLQLLTASAVPRHQLILGVSWRCPTSPPSCPEKQGLGIYCSFHSLWAELPGICQGLLDQADQMIIITPQSRNSDSSILELSLESDTAPNPQSKPRILAIWRDGRLRECCVELGCPRVQREALEALAHLTVPGRHIPWVTRGF